MYDAQVKLEKKMTNIERYGWDLMFQNYLGNMMAADDDEDM